MIVHTKHGYIVKSHTGQQIAGPYDDREDAKKRLQQIEFYKTHPARRRGRKNPLGSGFGFGLLAGAAALGGIWFFVARKAQAAASGSDCYLCVVPNNTTVPTNAGQVQAGTYLGFPFSSYFLMQGLDWGASININGHIESTWSAASRDAAIVVMKKFADGYLVTHPIRV